MTSPLRSTLLFFSPGALSRPAPELSVAAKLLRMGDATVPEA